MTTAFRFTSADLERFPEIEGVRYEIIDGELYVSRAPSLGHQMTCNAIGYALHGWSVQSGLGVLVQGPGLVFANDQDVIPDAVWISNDRLSTGLDEKGHLRVAPEIVIEVLSPGRANELRDRETKRTLYARRGVQEYWVADWRERRIDVYRQRGLDLDLVASLADADELSSPLLPGFRCSIANFWPPVPLTVADDLD